MIKIKSEMFEKAMEITKMYGELQDYLNKDILSMKMDNSGLSFQIYSKEEFVKVAKDNLKMFEVEELPEDRIYPYRFKTAVDGIEFYMIADQSEHDYIVNQLF